MHTCIAGMSRFNSASSMSRTLTNEIGDDIAPRSRSYSVAALRRNPSINSAVYPLTKLKSQKVSFLPPSPTSIGQPCLCVVQYTFTITIIDVVGLPLTMGNVFCQFKFYNSSSTNKVVCMHVSVQITHPMRASMM